MPKKILTIFGATGNQGGSVVRAILSDPSTAAIFHVRAVTRDPSKAASVALAELGAEIVQVRLFLPYAILYCSHGDSWGG
jgi:uncharacterized protein YbjT (DUF2867 family)